MHGRPLYCNSQKDILCDKPSGICNCHRIISPRGCSRGGRPMNKDKYVNSASTRASNMYRTMLMQKGARTSQVLQQLTFLAQMMEKHLPAFDAMYGSNERPAVLTTCNKTPWACDKPSQPPTRSGANYVNTVHNWFYTPRSEARGTLRHLAWCAP